jgi:hypothetical protein
MLFIEAIRYILTTNYKDVKCTDKEIKVLNLIIFTICHRLLIIMTKMTEHCNRTIIKDAYASYAMQIEFPNINYNLSNIKLNKHTKHIINSSIRNIYYQKVASVYEITKTTTDILSNLLMFLIHYFIKSSDKNANNAFSYTDTLAVLKKNNQALYNNVLIKYHLKK